MKNHKAAPGGDDRQRITSIPGMRSGKAAIRGMRITVDDVLGYLASGMSREEILEDFPELTPEDIDACLAYDRIRRPDAAKGKK